MNSPTHRENILNGHFTEIGIATAQGAYQGRSTTFVVQMFGTPSTTFSPKKVVLDTPATVSTAPVREVTVPTTPTEIAIVTTEAVNTTVLGTEADSILPSPAPTSWWQHVLASPKSMLRYAYYALAGIVFILLAYVTELEFHRRHLRHVGAAVLLFVLMAGLFTLAHVFFFSDPIIVALTP